MLSNTPKVTRINSNDDDSMTTIDLTLEQVEEVNEWFNPETNQVEREPYPGCWGFEEFGED